MDRSITTVTRDGTSALGLSILSTKGGCHYACRVILRSPQRLILRTVITSGLASRVRWWCPPGPGAPRQLVTCPCVHGLPRLGPARPIRSPYRVQVDGLPKENAAPPIHKFEHQTRLLKYSYWTLQGRRDRHARASLALKHATIPTTMRIPDSLKRRCHTIISFLPIGRPCSCTALKSRLKY
jgi:hypothetical protein